MYIMNILYNNKPEVTLAFSICVSKAIHVSVFIIISYPSTDINISLLQIYAIKENTQPRNHRAASKMHKYYNPLHTTDI